MRADADNHEPFGLFGARGIGLRIAQRGDVDILRRLDLLGRAVIDKEGLPRQATVSRWPACTGARSTSVVESASVSLAGFRLSVNGQIAQAAPMPPSAPAVRIRKSRRVPPSWPAVTCECARSAIYPS